MPSDVIRGSGHDNLHNQPKRKNCSSRVYRRDPSLLRTSETTAE